MNMAVDILVDIVIVIVRAKAIPQGVLLLLATPPEMVKIRSIAVLHVNRQEIPLRKVSLLFLEFVHSASSLAVAEALFVCLF